MSEVRTLPDDRRHPTQACCHKAINDIGMIKPGLQHVRPSFAGAGGRAARRPHGTAGPASSRVTSHLDSRVAQAWQRALLRASSETTKLSNRLRLSLVATRTENLLGPAHAEAGDEMRRPARLPTASPPLSRSAARQRRQDTHAKALLGHTPSLAAHCAVAPPRLVEQSRTARRPTRPSSLRRRPSLPSSSTSTLTTAYRRDDNLAQRRPCRSAFLKLHLPCAQGVLASGISPTVIDWMSATSRSWYDPSEPPAPRAQRLQARGHGIRRRRALWRRDRHRARRKVRARWPRDTGGCCRADSSR